MARIERLALRLQTGARGTPGPVLVEFNGHELGCGPGAGGTDAGEVFEGQVEPRSVAHSVVLVGPESGDWDLERIEVTYDPGDGEPWTVCLGPVSLDPRTAVDIWRPRPLPVFDV